MDINTPHYHCETDRLNIGLAPIEFDERTERVYGILEILNESRFGPYRFQRYFDEPVYAAPGNVVFDLMPAGSVMRFDGECSADPGKITSYAARLKIADASSALAASRINRHRPNGAGPPGINYFARGSPAAFTGH